MQLGDTRAPGAPPRTIGNSPGFETVDHHICLIFLCRFLFGIVKFSEIIVVPSKRTLLLDEVASCLLLPLIFYFMMVKKPAIG